MRKLLLATNVLHDDKQYRVVTSQTDDPGGFDFETVVYDQYSNQLDTFKSQRIQQHHGVTQQIIDFGVGWLHTSKLSIRMCACGTSASGQDVYFTKVECSPTQRDSGEHYKVLEGYARDILRFKDPIWVCEERDAARCVLDGWKRWDKVPVLSIFKEKDQA